ncbi:hypothetical protein CJP74_03580 [Psittacicella melopsittaci]|uniref:Uncharacterized protein n=1 Tax=Psittacicella melopsittaci TaxID=2028576 RepID=A0A3A1Y699_9GAMM|nr:hypothetical protein [Psittacicella melopsittaci]RIY32789.1 hypothetical protein CJP74_03580 [Psittacicella melopsittaci]
MIIATTLFLLFWGYRIFSNIKKEKFSFDTQMFYLAGLISFILYLLASHVLGLAQGVFNHTLLIMLAFALLNLLYLIFTRREDFIDYASKHRDILFSRKSVITFTLTEAIISLYAFVAYMRVPQGFVLGLNESVLEIITSSNTIGMAILAIIACRFFYVLTLGTYRILAFWLVFALSLTLCGGIFTSIYMLLGSATPNPTQILTHAMPYVPLILYVSIIVTLRLIRGLLVRNDSRKISFSSIIPYVLRTLAGLVEPICLSIIVYCIIVYFIGVATVIS